MVGQSGARRRHPALWQPYAPRLPRLERMGKTCLTAKSSSGRGSPPSTQAPAHPEQPAYLAFPNQTSLPQPILLASSTDGHAKCLQYEVQAC